MANDLNIESLSIDFEVTSAAALSAVDKLVEKLTALKTATQGGLQGASSIAKGLEKITQAAQGFNSVDGSKINSVVESLNKLKNLSISANITTSAEQIKNLSKIANSVANIPTVDEGKLQSISEIGAALSGLSNVPQIPDFSSTARSLSQVGTAVSGLSGVDMGTVSSKIQELTSALSPLETLGKTNLSSFINSLKKLPEISYALSTLDYGQFSTQIQDVSQAIHPLTTEFESLASSISSMPAPIQNAVAGLMNFDNEAQNTAKSTNNLLTKIKNLLSIAGAVAVWRKVKSVFGGMVESSNMFVENMNLFAVTMGTAADEALNFANRVNELMGIDVSQWIQNQGYFKQIASGFGVVESKANLMSQNLTQLGYDISSFFNISVEDAMLKLQSGISGELEPLRRIGYALDVATLQQVAYNHGIEISIQNMTQAQKSQLRYIAIMEQSKNAMGDMARTLESPANQMRIFEQRVDQLKRAIGNGLMPVISALLPYATALIRLLTEGAQKIAEFLGFEIPVFDYGDLIANKNDGITSSFEDATAAAKEFKGTLSSIDQLNIIGTEKEKKGSGIGDMYDLNIDLPSYDFLGDLEESADNAYNAIKNLVQNALPWLAAFGGAFAAIKLSGLITSISQLGTALGLSLSKWTPFKTAIAAAASSGILLYSSIKNLIKGTGSLKNNIAMLAAGIGIAVAAIAGFIAYGNPAGAVITGIGVAIGVVVGAVQGLRDAHAEEAARKISDAFEYGEIPISEFASAIEDVASGLTSSESKYLTTKQSLKGISDNAEIAGTKIHNMVSELKATGTLAEEEIAQMKSAFEDLAKASKDYISESNNNFKLYILANQDMLAAQGYSVSSMVELINKGTDNSINKIQELQSEADMLTKKLQSGGLSASESLRLEEINTSLLKKAGVDVNFGVDITETKNVLESLSSIKFENATTAAEAMNKAYDSAAEAYAKLASTKISMNAQIDEFEIPESEKQYLRNAINDLFNVKYLQLDEALTPALNSLMAQAKSLYSNVEAAVAEETAKNVSGIGMFFAKEAWSSYLGTSFKDINTEKVKEQLGDAYSFLANPMEALRSSFAKKGVGQDIVDEMFKVGADSSQGFADGTLSKSNAVEEAGRSISGRLIGTTKETLDSHSPSKVAFEIGEDWDAGLLLGIKSRENDVLTELSNFGKQINEAIVIAPLDWSALMGTPDFSNVYVPNTAYSYAANSGAPVQSEGYDPRSVAEAAQIWSSTERPIDVKVHVQSYLEMDGETLGSAVSDYNNNQMVYSNGVNQ